MSIILDALEPAPQAFSNHVVEIYPQSLTVIGSNHVKEPPSLGYTIGAERYSGATGSLNRQRDFLRRCASAHLYFPCQSPSFGRCTSAWIPRMSRGLGETQKRR